MAKKTFEELVQLKQDKKIGWLDFVRLGDNAEEYARWCEDHGTEPFYRHAHFLWLQGTSWPLVCV